MRRVGIEDLRQRLRRLAESPPPAELNREGAMCYSVAPPPDRAEYLCPACGERTLYVLDERAHPGAPDGLPAFVEFDLQGCRNAAAEIEGVDLRIEESEFCKACRPEVESPRIGLTVKHPGKPPHTTWNVAPEDLRLIREFLAGEPRHKAFNDAEEPLRDHVRRLAKLLGVDPRGER
jgi:hypothetical protein